MAYSVPPLPYDYNALEPTIDEATMKLHHDKHHQAYVDNANKALDGTEWADKDVVEVLKNLSSLPSDKQGRRRPRRCHQLSLRLIRRLQDPVQGGRRRPLRLRLGLAGPRRLRAGDRLHRQPGQPRLRRQDPAAGHRRLGARLLPQVQQPASGLHRRLVGRGQLAEGRGGVLRRLVASFGVWASACAPGPLTF
jgi:hypothetical protein